MREIVGETPIASALAEGRGKIETDTQTLLQQILDSYGAGIEITEVQLQKVDPPAPVIDAFRDVQRARADQDRQRNIADSYRNAILPRARGTAAQIVQQAEAYRQQVVARAEGDADRFRAVEQAYKTAKDVTLQRIYLDTMADILKDSHKVIIDKAVGGVLPVLPLPGLAAAALQHSAAQAGSQSGAGSDTRTGGQSQGASPGTADGTSPADPSPADMAPTDTAPGGASSGGVSSPGVSSPDVSSPGMTSSGDGSGSEMRNER
jgi:membrane protease subunit HflK